MIWYEILPALDPIHLVLITSLLINTTYPYASRTRIRENLCNTLTRKFIDEMKLYQNAQQKYKSDIKKKVTRQVQIVKPDATDEEVDMVMRSEGGREALYRESILAGDVSDSIK